MLKKSQKIIYLDSAATTSIDPQVLKAMEPYWTEQFGNPSSLYKSGIEVRRALAKARESIAAILSCTPKEIIFTSGGTESVNLAIFGIARQYELANRKKGHVIVSSIEHDAVLNSARALQEEGWRVDHVPVDAEGFIKLDTLKDLVRKDTVLVSVMYANNEIGTIEPISEIGRWLNGLNKARLQKKLPRIYFHTDACQAAGSLNLNVDTLKVDLLSLNASKIYGPKGVGILYARTGVQLRPIIFGGGQEGNIRSGTENVPAIIGFSKALELAQTNKDKTNKHLLGLQKFFDEKLRKALKHFNYNGPSNLHSTNRKLKSSSDLARLPNNINITIPGIEGESLMLYLDASGVQVATGSACSTASDDPSQVLLAIGLNKKQAKETIRITLGKHTNKRELEYAVWAIKEAVAIILKGAAH